MSCTCNTENKTMILACSGGSNVGQLSNQAAVELTQEGFGKMFCLAGIGGHLYGFVQSAKDVENLVVIDGCRVGCAKAILDHQNITPARYLVIDAEVGIEKNKEMNLKREDIDAVKTAIKTAGSTKAEAPGGCSCCK